jgi:prefoldin subunit 5
MRFLYVFVVSVAVVVIGAAPDALVPAVAAQSSAQEKAANLRAQLSEVETKQAELQTRRQDLDEQLKPENIEKTLAGVGSTKPEDLREQRRRQLEIERNGVQRQLDLLATSHTRLEAAIAQADAEAYRQSAAPSNTASGGPSVNAASTTSDSTGAAVSPAAAPTRPRRVRKRKKTGTSKRTTSSAMPLKAQPERIATASESVAALQNSRGDGGV